MERQTIQLDRSKKREAAYQTLLCEYTSRVFKKCDVPFDEGTFKDVLEVTNLYDAMMDDCFEVGDTYRPTDPKGFAKKVHKIVRPKLKAPYQTFRFWADKVGCTVFLLGLLGLIAVGLFYVYTWCQSLL